MKYCTVCKKKRASLVHGGLRRGKQCSGLNKVIYKVCRTFPAVGSWGISVCFFLSFFFPFLKKIRMQQADFTKHKGIVYWTYVGMHLSIIQQQNEVIKGKRKK